LSEFISTFHEGGGARAEKNLEIFCNRSTLMKIQRKRVQADQKPLEYSSDEDLDYMEKESENLLEDRKEADFFEVRVDENAKLLQGTSDQMNGKGVGAILSDEDQVKLFVAKTKELFDREKGKSVSKKLNLGDTYSCKVETPAIIQQHLLPEDTLKLIDRNLTLIYGNIKAIIPLVRERLQVESDPENENQPRYRRGPLVPLREKVVFGILTRDQVGHIPSVDVCFTEDEETFLRDTYLFKSLVSAKLYDKPGKQDLFDNSESATLSLAAEIRNLREFGDYSQDYIANEMVTQFVQAGTLSEIEAFHEFLMRDLYREERPIDFQAAFT
jgi:hypothetical protein